MNEDIIRMAREAGIRDCTCNGEFGCLERFAALVAAASEAKEREAIIDLVAMYGGPVDLEAAIRARGQA
jgi:hypothetical protein